MYKHVALRTVWLTNCCALHGISMCLPSHSVWSMKKLQSRRDAMPIVYAKALPRDDSLLSGETLIFLEKGRQCWQRRNRAGSYRMLHHVLRNVMYHLLLKLGTHAALLHCDTAIMTTSYSFKHLCKLHAGATMRTRQMQPRRARLPQAWAQVPERVWVQCWQLCGQ